MPASEARIASNRRNAALSTGPRTPEGKAASRGNALKHGMTGGGVVLPAEAATEAERLAGELAVEMRPSNPLAMILVKRVAAHAVQLDLCVRQEQAGRDERVRHAATRFDAEQAADVDRLFEGILDEPEAVVRQLGRTPRGVDRMLRAWDSILDDLRDFRRVPFTVEHQRLAEALAGRSPGGRPSTRLGVICDVLASAKIDGLEPGELDLASMSDEQAFAWARDQFVGLIAVEVARLGDLKEELDPSVDERDRAEAGERVLVDLSTAGVLARKYEAAAERGLYRALKEFRQVEAEVKAEAKVAAPEVVEPGAGALGSFFQGEAPPPAPSVQPFPKAVSAPMPVPLIIGGSDDGPKSGGPGVQGFR